MLEKYCEIRYRDYLLEISKTEYVTGKFSYQGKGQDKDSIYLGGPYTDVGRVIHDFIYLLDKELGEREKEEEILFCTIIYKGYELKVYLKTEDLYYCAWITGFDFASWGENWSIEKLVSIIEAFRKKVDSGTGEDLIQNITDYKGHRLVVRKKKDSDNKYIGTSSLLDGKWKREGYLVDFIVEHFKLSVNRIVEKEKKMVETTYQEVYDEWGSHSRIVNYKNRQLRIEVISHPKLKDLRPFYIGYASIYPRHDYFKDSKSFESIHYNKVISRFEKWVDEYCTDWRFDKPVQYKGFNITIKKEQSKENYFGYVQFHKNSTFKHIADTREEVERCCEMRINRVIYEKEKVQRKTLTPKQEKTQELEQLLARISAQLEELKKEKDTWIYKGVVLEYGTDDELDKGYFVGRVKNAPKGTQEFYGKIESVVKSNLENYIDDLENCYNLYCKLTNKEE